MWAGIATAGACLAGLNRDVRRREMSPLREGFALSAANPQPNESESTIGLDTKGVKRPTAPAIKPQAKASFARARAALGSEESTAAALSELDADVYARSSVVPREGRWRVIHLLAAGACRPFAPLPLTRDKLRLLGAALKAGSYRSAKDYLLVAKKMHLVCGGVWDEALNSAMADVTRSVTRGLGPPKQAASFSLDELADRDWRAQQVEKEGPRCVEAAGMCMALWMLRGLEAASALGEQATISADRGLASLDLGPTNRIRGDAGAPDPRVRVCKSGRPCERSVQILPSCSIGVGAK